LPAFWWTKATVTPRLSSFTAGSILLLNKSYGVENIFWKQQVNFILLLNKSYGVENIAEYKERKTMENKKPSMDQWLEEAKKAPQAELCGMYLTHVGVVRATPKAQVRGLEVKKLPKVKGMDFSFDAEKVEAAKKSALQMDGIFYVRVWLNEGTLDVGDDIMQILIGGDIRPHVVDALQFLVGEIKDRCVKEIER